MVIRSTLPGALLALLLSHPLLGATVQWTGAVDDKWSTPGNWSTGMVPAEGDTLVFPAGAAHKTNTNDLAAGRAYQALQFGESLYVLNGNSIDLSGGISTSGFITGTTTLKMAIGLLASQSVSAGGNGLGFGGNVDLQDFTLSLSTGGTSFTGVVSGSGGLSSGIGSLFLTAANTYSGPTIAMGPVTINGSQPASSVSVSGSSAHWASLAGVGVLGATTVTNADVRPGGLGVRGILTTGSLSVSGGVPPAPGAKCSFEIGGTAPGTGHDQIRVLGTVDFTGTVNAQLDVVLDASFTPTIGQAFVLVDNDGNDAMTGSFYGLPEAATTTFGGYSFRVSYVGGTGNDVTLTALSGNPAPVAAAFYPIAPCRVLDTRLPSGGPNLPPPPPWPGPSFQPYEARSYTLAGYCGIRSDAVAFSGNVTIVNAAEPGFLRVYPPGATGATPSTINFEAGHTRANNVMSALAAGAVIVHSDSAGSLDVVLDVAGYFK